MHARVPPLAAKLNVEIEEEDIQGVPVRHLTPAKIAAEHADHLFVAIHRGACVLGAGTGSVVEGVFLAANLGIRVVAIDYRMPPEHPAPAAVDDVVTVVRHVTAERAAETIALAAPRQAGTSRSRPR